MTSSLPRLAAVLVAGLAVPAALLLIAGPAGAAPPPYAEHVRTCALAGHLDGDHNPGTHKGASGWDPTHHCGH